MTRRQTTMRSFRRRPADRAGYTLALFAMFFFGMMGLAALVIDIAFVRSAQRRMETAVDSAALEGLRLGRQQASDMVANVFDDNFNPQDGDPNNYGAGPEVTLPAGLVLTASYAAADARRSDSAGLQADPGVEHRRCAQRRYGGGNLQPCRQPSTEADDYTRADFTYGSSGSNSFLVRMHRTATWTRRRASARAVRRFPGCLAAAR